MKKIPFFVFLRKYSRASEVNSKCKIPRQHNPDIVFSAPWFESSSFNELF